jgi:hypothetical protein
MMVDAREEKNGILKMQEILNIIYNCKRNFSFDLFFSSSCIYCIIIWSQALKDYQRGALGCDLSFITISSTPLSFRWIAFALRFPEHISPRAFRAKDKSLLQVANNRKRWWADHIHDTHCCSSKLRLVVVLVWIKD